MKGQTSAKEKLEDLKKLCIKNKEVVGKMARLLEEITAAGGTLGTCYPIPPADWEAFPSTESVCNAYPGRWVRLDDLFERMLQQLPEAAKRPATELMDHWKNNKQLVQLVNLLKDVNKERPGEIGICRLKNGDCIPGTKKECEQGGGVWTYIQQFQPQQPKG